MEDPVSHPPTRTGVGEPCLRPPLQRPLTDWGDARVGDAINLEIDTLARYVARLAEAGQVGA